METSVDSVRTGSEALCEGLEDLGTCGPLIRIRFPASPDEGRVLRMCVGRDEGPLAVIDQLVNLRKRVIQRRL
jgi:hypothetical protein